MKQVKYLCGLNYNFLELSPYLSMIQMKNHYEGHYLKYISKTNKIIEQHELVKKLYQKIQELNIKNKLLCHDIFFRCIIKHLHKFVLNKTDINMISQAYFHEIFFSGLTSHNDSISSLQLYKLKIFGSYEAFDKIYSEYINLSTKHFSSGWIWFVYFNNKIIVVDTQDAEHPNYDLKYILMTIDLWEHAYYTEYVYKRDDYIKKVFMLINWKIIYDKIGLLA
jgi:Fe-Mn family superoxide dismutase